jgi:hypothetical protein
MKFLQILLMLTFFASCSSEVEPIMNIQESWEEVNFWRSVPYPEAKDYRSFILEGQLHFDYIISNEEKFIETINKIKSKAPDDINELKIKSIVGIYSIVTPSPFDFEENWIEYLDKIELIYMSEEEEIIMGTYTSDMPLYESKRYKIEINEDANALESIISSSGNFIYRFSFTSFPQNELKIIHNQSQFFIKYDLIN